ncbi:MAG: divalent-cation tolerance protein CutA [Flexibacter sp. CG_4_10_14_3_um_filter_32_15]|nr:MAG: divalent-cation tolerance protein CutA [Flexibacter sp. CG_4_10_14_3_um_filter_32_15]
MPKLALFYVPCKDEDETLHLSKLLLDKKLVACTNSMPIKSCYFWQGNIENDTEQVLIAKTLTEKTKKVTRFLEQYHSYDTPCIAFWEIDINEEYFEWVKSQV